MVKNPSAMQETWVRSLGWEDPLEKGIATTPVILPGDFQGQRSLAGYSPWGHKELDMTAFTSLCPTLCNPMDCSPRLFCPWDFPYKNTGMGCHFLLQGIFLTQGIEPMSPALGSGFFTNASPGKTP